MSGRKCLGTLSCSSNSLVSLDLSECSELKFLNCAGNMLTTLSVTDCISLQELTCSENDLISLDVSNLTDLRWIFCMKNNLTSLNVTGCVSLNTLWCKENKITQVIPDWFTQIKSFSYDVRYYYKANQYEDNGVGWWYPGEPDRGYHKK